MADYAIRTNDVEAGEMLQQMAKEDLRTIGNEVAWIIRQEWARRNAPAQVEQPAAATANQQ